MCVCKDQDYGSGVFESDRCIGCWCIRAIFTLVVGSCRVTAKRSLLSPFFGVGSRVLSAHRHNSLS